MDDRDEEKAGLTPIMTTTLVTLSKRMALEITPEQLMSTLMGTVFKDSGATQADLALVLHVANKFDLDPITREIYAFKDQHGRVVPIVAVDGWYKIANAHPQYDGLTFEYEIDSQNPDRLSAVTAKVHRKDRSHPIEATEWYDECVQFKKDGTTLKPAWEKYPRRMLKHKAAIQGFRMAFGYSGFYDPDEGERIVGSPDDIETTATADEPVAKINVDELKELNRLIAEVVGDDEAAQEAFADELKVAFNCQGFHQLPLDKMPALRRAITVRRQYDTGDSEVPA